MIDAILERTRPLQELLFSLPFFGLVRRRLIRTEQYVALMRAMAIITETLELELEGLVAENRLTGWNSSHRRGPLFEQDLKTFRSPLVPDLVRTFEEAQKTVSAIRLRTLEKPFALIGHLVVLELMTGRVAGLASLIKEACDLKDGMRWLQETPPTAIEALPDGARDAVEDGVREGIEAMGRILTTISPERDDERRVLVTAINPEAGRHPIPSDPLELDAALAAGERCWARVPLLSGPLWRAWAAVHRE